MTALAYLLQLLVGDYLELRAESSDAFVHVEVLQVCLDAMHSHL